MRRLVFISALLAASGCAELLSAAGAGGHAAPPLVEVAEVRVVELCVSDDPLVHDRPSFANAAAGFVLGEVPSLEIPYAITGAGRARGEREST